MNAHIPIANWGKDHWSTLLYIESIIFDVYARPAMDKMRQHSGRIRRGWDSPMARVVSVFSQDYPTQTIIRDPNNWDTIIGHTEVHDHDDWDCIDDMETEGLLEQLGTGLQPVVKLTDYGYTVVAALKKNGCNFRTLKLPERPVTDPD